MSNRRRISRQARGYAARVQRQPGRPRVRTGGRRWRRPDAGWLPPGLAVVAEAGHLVAGYLEWPGSPAAGVYHVAVGALLGWFAAMVVAGGTGRGPLVAGAVVAGSGPVLWLAGSLLAASPYRQLPAPAVAGVVAAEIVLVGLLLPAVWRLGPAAELRSE